MDVASNVMKFKLKPEGVKLVEIRTPRLLLRGARLEDAEDLFQAMADDEVMTYWSHGPHSAVSDTTACLSRMISTPYNGTVDFIIVLLPTPSSSRYSVPVSRPTVIGRAGCWNGEEIGFLLRKECWGEGYAIEALAAIVKHVWANTDIDVITADVDPMNEASLGLLARFGFVVMGEMKNSMETHMGWCDSVYLKLSRPAG